MLTPLRVVIALEILGVAGMIFGFLPREAALFLLGIFAYFALFAPLKDALLFTVFSIPLYTALPITETFDTMAGWRIIIAILFLRILGNGIFYREINAFLSSVRVVFAPRKGETSSTPLLKKNMDSPVKSQKQPSPMLGMLAAALFVIGALSLVVAQEPSFGIRKILFLANIFFLFFVIQRVIKNKQDWLDVFKYTFAGALLTLAIDYAQLVSVFFVSLHGFWMWWVGHVIPVFYGTALANLLSYSNTWFSYYENAEPTLRVFSVFPDSHSLALSMVLLLPMALTYYFFQKKRFKSENGIRMPRIEILEMIVVLALLAIIFSGTRGVWVGAIPVLLVLAAVFVSRNLPQKMREFAKIGLIVLIAFVVLFPVASQIQKISQIRQGGKASDATTLSRITTSFRTEELSNKGRIQIWKSTLESIIKHPFLGVGIGNYPVVLSENVSATKKGASAHSLYLDFMSEIGILGGIVVLLIFLEILRQSLRVFLSAKDQFFMAFSGFFAIFLLWVMAYSIVDVVLLNDKVLLIFTTLVALVYAISRTKISMA